MRQLIIKSGITGILSKFSPSLIRVMFLLLAALSLILAILGFFLPGLPCVEFLLLASWFAARSSPRLHRWIMRHRWFGPMLENWRQGRVPRRAKWVSTVAMAVSATVMILTVSHFPSVIITIVCMSAVLLWLWRKPET